MSDSALSLLQAGEICVIYLQGGEVRHASWNPGNRGFHFCDGKGIGFVSNDYVEEWLPARYQSATE